MGNTPILSSLAWSPALPTAPGTYCWAQQDRRGVWHMGLTEVVAVDPVNVKHYQEFDELSQKPDGLKWKTEEPPFWQTPQGWLGLLQDPFRDPFYGFRSERPIYWLHTSLMWAISQGLPPLNGAPE